MILHIGRNTPKELIKGFNCSLSTYYNNKQQYFNSISKFADCRGEKNNIIINDFINMPHKEKIDSDYWYSMPSYTYNFTPEEEAYYLQLLNANKVDTNLRAGDEFGLKIGEEYPIEWFKKLDKNLIKYYRTGYNSYVIYEINTEIIEKIINNNLDKKFDIVLNIVKSTNETYGNLNLRAVVSMLYYKRKIQNGE